MIFDHHETQQINRLIFLHGQNKLTEREFFAAEIKQWKTGRARRDQLDGERYYRGKHDILQRKRTVVGQNGVLETVDNLPNNRIVDNQFALMVDQKTNYLVGKPFTLSCDNDEYTAQLENVFGDSFRRLLKYVCEDALCGGLGWIYPYYDGDGKLAFRRLPPHSVLPFWADDDHTELDCAIRLYPQQVYDGRDKKTVERVEIFKKDGIYRYSLSDGGELLPDIDGAEHENYISATDGEGGVRGYNWTRIPLIPFKANKQEQPLLCRVRSLQDAINEIQSDFMNNMQEDARNTILVITNYDGENLGEFRRNLAQYGAVKVRGDGGVSTLTVEVNADNYKAILDVLKKALIENARGYNAKDERLSGNPNQMNIQSMYSDIDLDANVMEVEFRASFGQLLWFVNKDLANRGLGDHDGERVRVVFNRDMLINESEAIDNCAKSAGMLSDETIIEQHPWVADAKTELERINEQRKSELM